MEVESTFPVVESIGHKDFLTQREAAKLLGIVDINDSKTSLNAKTNKIIEMKQFVIKAYDGEDKLDKRMEVRPHHFEGMEK